MKLSQLPAQPPPLPLDGVHDRFDDSLVDALAITVPDDHVDHAEPQEHGEDEQPLDFVEPAYRDRHDRVDEEDDRQRNDH